MARYFSVSRPDAMSSLRLDSRGQASVQYAAKNVCGVGLDGRAVLVSLARNSSGGVVEKGWVRVDGPTDRRFEKDKEEVFAVRVAVPLKLAAPGDYAFRLDLVNVARPDEGDQGPAVGFNVVPTPARRVEWWWIAAVAAAILALSGLIVWLLARGTPVPDLTGMSITDAEARLATVKLGLDPNGVETVESAPQNSGKIVGQNPKPNTRVSSKQAVQVTVGARMVSVPLLIGHKFQEVQAILAASGLSVGKSALGENPNFAAGVVFAQNPQVGQNVNSGTSVDLQVTPQTVTVQQVTGQPLAAAIARLQSIGLTVTSIQGNTAESVVAQNPPPGAVVPVGTGVSLSFPMSGVCAVPAVCWYRGSVGNLLVLEQARPQHW